MSNIKVSGNEFKGSMQKYLELKGITLKMLKSNQKAAVAERVRLKNKCTISKMYGINFRPSDQFADCTENTKCLVVKKILISFYHH